MTDTIGTVKVKGRKRSTFALILSIVTLGAAGYLYYQGIKLHAQTVYQLQSLDNASASNSLELARGLTAVNNQISQIQNKITAISSDKFSANNYQLNNLISLANQSLIVYHDVNSAIKLLGYAQNILQSDNNAQYTELKVAITTDLDNLKQLPVIDRVIIATKLNNIIDNTDHLELIVNNVPIVNQASIDTKQAKWKLFLSNIKSKLFGLVQVSNANKNDVLNLLPQNQAIIHQNIKLDILNARMALLQNDEANWQYSLNAAKQSLAVYFIDNVKMQNTLNQLDELEKINISYEDTGIDGTLKALNKLNNLSANDIGK
jgi:uroporphyrin-3 C-methyltransferase